MHVILGVEDEPALRSILRALFEAENYRFVEASTAARADVMKKAGARISPI